MSKYLLRLLLVFIIFFSGDTLFSQQKKIDKARNQYDKYQYVDAQQTYLRVVEKGHKSAELYSKLGDSYYFNGQYEEALQWYEELVNSYPEEVEREYYYRYAQTLKTAQRYGESDIFMKKFAILDISDKRSRLFILAPDYLARIEDQSGRFGIENSSINSLFADFGAAFYGDQIVFSSSKDTLIFKNNLHQWNNEAFLDLFVTSYDSVSGSFSRSRKLDKNINSKFHESTPVFTSDGRTVYFTRNNFDEGKLGRDKKGTNKLKIFRSYKNPKGGWTTPQNLSFNNDEYSVAHPALSIDEKTLYFSSDMPGGMGASDLYKIEINADGSFGEPENLGDRINTKGKETFPFISKNNDIYFSSDGYMGLGGLDVYVTKLEPTTGKEGWIINVGKPINGPKDDFAFIVNDETKRGFFSSNREGGKGSDDIYNFTQFDGLKSYSGVIVEMPTDKDTGEKLVGSVISIYDGNNKLIREFVVTDEEVPAFYSVKVLDGEVYTVRVEKNGYVTQERIISTPGEEDTFRLVFTLEKVTKSVIVGDDLAKILSLNPIYFDFNDYIIREDAKVELAKVIEVMKQNPDLKIDIRSHTDSRASAAYNKKLSSRRAVKTLNYIAIIGEIDRSRLTSKGYGEEELINNCVYGVECSEEEHQKNRRSEFIIIEQ